MTKEAILNKYDTSQKYIEQTCRPELFAAMDLYAKQQAIAFGEWLKDNRWHYQEYLHRPSCWRYFNEKTEEDIEKSTEELHDQFIEQQNKSNGK